MTPVTHRGAGQMGDHAFSSVSRDCGAVACWPLWINIWAVCGEERARRGRILVPLPPQALSSVNAPPPERRWLRVTAQSRIGPPLADSGHVEVIVWLGWRP